MTEVSKEATLTHSFHSIFVRFRKDQNDTRVLINSGSEVNAVHLAYAADLGLPVRKTDVGAEKIDGSHLETFRIKAGFQIQDGKGSILQKTKVVSGMPFLTLNSADLV